MSEYRGRRNMFEVRRHHPQRGVTSLLFALLLPILLGLGALAVDFAYLLTVKNELQNAADAAALGGANYLYVNGQPNWSVAIQKAQEAITLNSAGGITLRNASVTAGYWNASLPSGTLQSLPMTPTLYDVPALKVVVSKSNQQNSGEVGVYFAKFLGILSAPVSVSSVAGRTSPGSVEPGGVFPIVMSQCMFDSYWNFNAVPPGPQIDPLTNQNKIFQLGNATYGSCASGQWTSLDADSNSASFIKNLVTHMNPKLISVGDLIWVQTGVKTSNYDDVNSCSAAGNKSCEYVTIPIANIITGHAHSPISGFACLRILRAVGGNSKFIEVQMSTNCDANYSGGVGPGYGVVSPSSLLQ
jgi:Flp pilus assembly protein TadG